MKTAHVGTSSRTPYKHWLLNTLAGKVIGAAATGKAHGGRDVVMIDLCAGDGEDSFGPHSSSPSILLHHSTSRFHFSEGMKRRVICYEREGATFEKLAEKFAGNPTMQLNLGDSREFSLSKLGIREGVSVLVYADPNSISTLPVTAELVQSFTGSTLFLMTLGCNVAGTKRLPIEDRMGWFKTVELVRSKIRHWHDMHLITLNRDSSQWAYLTAVPKLWSEQMLTASVRAGNAMWPNGVTGVSLKTNPKEFQQTINRLFLTKEEKDEQSL